MERDGARLALDGEPYRYTGMMALLTYTGHGPDWIDRAMDLAARYGIDTFRCWGFPSTSDDVPAPHPEPGEFDDTWLELFDYTVAKAKETGVRLVVPLLQGVVTRPLAEDQTVVPSPATYGEWSDTAEYTRFPRAFIDDEQATGYFLEYVEHVLTRENQYTGTEYRNEPAILAWECANELEYKHPEQVGDSMADWYETVAGRVSSLDSNHLVSTGMHGSMGEVYEPWTERCAFVRDHQVEGIDLCSVHDYPIYGRGDGPVTIRSRALARRYVGHKVRLAHEEVGKPVYAGEYGAWFEPDADTALVSRIESPESASDVEDNADYPMAYPDQHDDGTLVTREVSNDGVDLEDRDEYFRNLTTVAEETAMDGVQFWRLSQNVAPEGERRRHRAEYDPLIVYPGDESTLEAIEEYDDQVGTV